MPEKYLVTYHAPSGGFFSELVTMQSLAEIIGFRDVNECEKIKVYRILPERVEQLEYRIHEWQKPCCVSLYTRWGNYVDAAYYPDH